jgi:hypothetical protein
LLEAAGAWAPGLLQRKLAATRCSARPATDAALAVVWRGKSTKYLFCTNSVAVSSVSADKRGNNFGLQVTEANIRLANLQ